MRILCLLCCVLAISGCQTTSSDLRSKALECSDVQRHSDFPGAKPTWNIFGNIKHISYCDGSGRTLYSFALELGSGFSDTANTSGIAFDEISEGAFRNQLLISTEFRPQAKSATIKHLLSNGRPILYTLKDSDQRPAVFFMMNDEAVSNVGKTWSQKHTGIIKSPVSVSPEAFEAWFLKTIQNFRNTGGDYSSAFSKQAIQSWARAPGTGWKSKFTDMPIHGKWDGVANTLKGSFKTAPNSKTGSLVFSLPDQNVRCYGTWTMKKGEFPQTGPTEGIWSVDCDNDQSASGVFAAKKGWHGLGNGQDNRGRKISFYYKPKSD